MKKLRIEMVVTYENDLLRHEVKKVKKVVDDILDNYSFGVESNWSKSCVASVRVIKEARDGQKA